LTFDSYCRRSQNRTPIQSLEEARDSIQTLHVGGHTIITGSVDGHVRAYDLRAGELRADYIGCMSSFIAYNIHSFDFVSAPITAILPTVDNLTYLVTTLDSHVRLMDASTGKMLNDFSGHAAGDYRIRAVLGHGEANIVCGDENGRVWAWDILDVCNSIPSQTPISPNYLFRGSRCNQILRRGCMIV
jgi:mitogen-activated protein kinase organizer 1